MSDIQLLIKENKRKLYFTFKQYVEILIKLINLYNDIFQESYSIWEKINNNIKNYGTLYSRINDDNDGFFLHNSFDDEKVKNKLKEFGMINFTINNENIEEKNFEINSWWDYISLYNTNNQISNIKTNFPYGHGIMVKIMEMIHKLLIFVNKIKNDIKKFNDNSDYSKIFTYYNVLTKELLNKNPRINIKKYNIDNSDKFERYPGESEDDQNMK